MAKKISGRKKRKLKRRRLERNIIAQSSSTGRFKEIKKLKELKEADSENTIETKPTLLERLDELWVTFFMGLTVLGFIIFCVALVLSVFSGEGGFSNCHRAGCSWNGLRKY